VQKVNLFPTADGESRMTHVDPLFIRRNRDDIAAGDPALDTGEIGFRNGETGASRAGPLDQAQPAECCGILQR